MAFVCGSHASNFPYRGDLPWDHALLFFGGEGYRFLQRRCGGALEIDISTSPGVSRGRLRFSGEMFRVRDRCAVAVELDIPVVATGYRLFGLGGPVKGPKIGMRWRPFELRGERGAVQVGDGGPSEVEEFVGQLEHARMRAVSNPAFAFGYDYVCVARPGSDGYAFVDFRGEPLRPRSLVGRALGRFMERFAQTITLDDGLIDGNPHEVDRTDSSDASVVLFESEVELRLATLRRQMIVTREASGAHLYGLREIFEPKQVQSRSTR